ncbi:hypothetical protein CTAYLR_003413 [Chrysophaeum taylorii]|uniref:BTB domain-containing protein n=1 Tax=Chrysophaeum taylorii TaxID=2483200 RepID=A0AAD7U9A1_9STRA|nr:hypothetical protein CTAYLR_003413 [Chrysophaeum taylorii]
MAEGPGFQMVAFGMPTGEKVGSFERMRSLYAEGQLTDFAICVTDEAGAVVREFAAHRCVLAAAGGGFFGALLAGAGSEMREGEARRVVLDDVDPELLSLVLDYCYGESRVEVEFERVVDLLGVAVRFQVRGLAEQCALTLRRALNERNCCELFAAADAHGCEDLRDAARDAVVSWLPTLLRPLRGYDDDEEDLEEESSGRVKLRGVSEDSADPSAAAAEVSVGALLSSRATRRAARRVAERDATFSGSKSSQPSTPVSPTEALFANTQSGFSRLPPALALEILSSDRIACEESIVFAAAVAWVETREAMRGTAPPRRTSLSAARRDDDDAADDSNRRGARKRRRATSSGTHAVDDNDRDVDGGEVEESALCDDILRRVRYPLMDATFLADVVKPHPAMQTPARGALVAEAFEHLALKAAGRDRGVLEGWPALAAGAEGEAYDLRKRAQPRQQLVAARVWPPRLDLARSFDAKNGHSDAVAALCVCAGRVVSGSWDSTVRVWDPETGTCEHTLDHDGMVRALADVSGQLVSSSEDVRVWDPGRAWAHVTTLRDHSTVVNAIVALDDDLPLADDDAPTSTDASPADADAALLGAPTGDDPPARRFASGDDDGSIKIWSASDLRCLLTLHGEASVGVLVLRSMPFKLLSGSDDAKIHVWSTRTWTLEHTLTHSDEIWALAIVGDSLISGSVDHTIKVWRTSDWVCERTLQAHDGPCYALTNLQNHLVSASSDETIKAWSHDFEVEANHGINCSGVWCLSVHNDRLVTGGINGVIKIWDR